MSLESQIAQQVSISHGPITPQEQARALKDHYGSIRKAAAAIGKNESVLRRALNGQTKTPLPGTREVIQKHAVRVAADRVRREGIKISFANGTRDRSVKVTEVAPGATPEPTEMRAGTADKVADAVARGDQDGATRAFLAGMGRGWYRDRFEDVYEYDGPAVAEDDTNYVAIG